MFWVKQFNSPSLEIVSKQKKNLSSINTLLCYANFIQLISSRRDKRQTLYSLDTDNVVNYSLKKDQQVGINFSASQSLIYRPTTSLLSRIYICFFFYSKTTYRLDGFVLFWCIYIYTYICAYWVKLVIILPRIYGSVTNTNGFWIG